MIYAYMIFGEYGILMLKGYTIYANMIYAYIVFVIVGINF